MLLCTMSICESPEAYAQGWYYTPSTWSDYRGPLYSQPWRMPIPSEKALKSKFKGSKKRIIQTTAPVQTVEAIEEIQINKFAAYKDFLKDLKTKTEIPESLQSEIVVQQNWLLDESNRECIKFNQLEQELFQNPFFEKNHYANSVSAIKIIDYISQRKIRKDSSIEISDANAISYAWFEMLQSENIVTYLPVRRSRDTIFYLRALQRTSRPGHFNNGPSFGAYSDFPYHFVLVKQTASEKKASTAKMKDEIKTCCALLESIITAYYRDKHKFEKRVDLKVAEESELAKLIGNEPFKKIEASWKGIAN